MDFKARKEKLEPLAQRWAIQMLLNLKVDFLGLCKFVFKKSFLVLELNCLCFFRERQVPLGQWELLVQW